MEQAERTKLKEYAREQLEGRIQLVQRSVHEQAGLYARRRDIIGVAEHQMLHALIRIQIGIERSRFSKQEIEDRAEIMDELLDELKTVPEVV